MQPSTSLFTLALLVAAQVCSAQQTHDTPPTDQTPKAIEADGAPATPNREASIASRWVTLNAFSFSFRYRTQQTDQGYHYFNNGQQRSLIDGALKLDPEGKYEVHFHVSSGKTFNWSFSNEIAPDYLSRIPAGFSFLTSGQLQSIYAAITADPQALGIVTSLPSRGWAMYARQLYFSASPVKQVTVEFGGLGIERGVNTEATSYDDDGYISGERLRIKDPRHLYLDEITFTNGYEGDIFTPNFFDRAERLGQSNYRQVMAAKSFSKRVKASADYTFDKGIHIVREAAAIKLPTAIALDSVRAEFYQRVNQHMLQGLTFRSGQGFAVTATKTFAKQFQLDAGYADVDPQYGVLTGSRLLSEAGFSMNGDAFLTGRRALVRANWKLTPYLGLFGYYTHEIMSPANLYLNRQSVNCGAIVDFKGLLTMFHAL